MRGEARKWFFVSGMAVSFSQMFRYLALSVAPVTVTQPIQATSLIWRMVFGYFINREHEAFDRYVLIGLCLSFSGAFALANGSKDAALLRMLPPGAYTVMLTGVGNTTGIGLVEVYDVDP